MGIHHRICHVLGGALDLPHAETHTIVLPHVVAHFEPAIPDVMASLREALGGEGTRPSPGRLYDSRRRHAHRPRSLAAIGMREQDLEPMNTSSSAPALGGGEHPREVDETAIRTILTGALEGRAPLPPRTSPRHREHAAATPDAQPER